ncbi:hypothetical protein LWI29_026354 [Acer saccharum]|uniref:Uncharacterized protein n=1 Tax=Acer saccharum TaxID=4024 RepID=A0AA39W598_ACESA|nr:hypothetical protein LWI29_026354 [Acer saccharum]
MGSTYEGTKTGMDTEEETNKDNNQAKASSSTVLTEISNRNPLNKKLLKPSASKYLVDSLSTTNGSSKQSKENGSEVGSRERGRGLRRPHNIQPLINPTLWQPLRILQSFKTCTTNWLK